MSGLTDAEALEYQLGRRPTLAERGVAPSEQLSRPPKERTGADWDNARSQFPSTKLGVSEWVEFFDDRPEVMYAILGDIYRESKAQEAREAGRAQTGRRPKAINGNLDDLNQMITPRYSLVPFPEALKELIGDRSLRAFALKIPAMNHFALTRMMRGEMKLEAWRLEAIAAAGKVSPSYFREYREMQFLEAVSRYLADRPTASVTILKRVRQDRATMQGRR